MGASGTLLRRQTAMEPRRRIKKRAPGGRVLGRRYLVSAGLRRGLFRLDEVTLHAAKGFRTRLVSRALTADEARTILRANAHQAAARERLAA